MLLREAIKDAGKAGIAKVVIRARQYLAALIAQGDALVLELLRYPQELADLSEFDLPGQDLREHGVTKKEIELAAKLIDGMTAKWNAGEVPRRVPRRADEAGRAKDQVRPDRGDRCGSAEEEAPVRQHDQLHGRAQEERGARVERAQRKNGRAAQSRERPARAHGAAQDSEPAKRSLIRVS